jgi:hypothetical protein
MPLLSFAGSPHGGRQRLLPEWNSQPPITPTTIIDHSIVGSADGAFGHFLLHTGIESHFIVDLDGEIQQLMNTDREADANLNANRFALSIETADDGDPDHFPWTRAQLESLAWLHNKLVAVHPSIPRRLCPSEAGGGLGYHTLFGAPSAWTPVAKSCPGAIRKRQWRDVLLPAFIAGEDLDMPFDASEEALLRALRDTVTGEGDFTGRTNTLSKVRGEIDLLQAAVADLHAKIDALGGGAGGGLTKQDVEDVVRAVFGDASTP